MVKKYLKNNLFVFKLYVALKRIYIKIIGEEAWESKRFAKFNGYIPNFKMPKTLNEKIAWLKIHYFEDIYYKCCDKYLVHQYLEDKLGRDYAPKLLFVTQTPSELTFDNIKVFPCIIKTSNGSGTNLIVKSKEQYTEAQIQKIFKDFIVKTTKHTVESLEHQYDVKHPYIVVEELLKDKKGQIPNDYKFLYINGELEFIYCSVDRTGANVRQIYDKDWNRLHFVWVAGADKKVFDRYDSSPSIDKPEHFDEMKKVSKELSSNFSLVRIDFYETDNRIYIGEITLHHGSGHDSFYPREFDRIYGEKLSLPQSNR